ncbi:MAG: MFS transporter [Deltaproteobacteria bacterium]|nr:MFS transporter [Deltaproteobacteria bacterium]
MTNKANKAPSSSRPDLLVWITMMYLTVCEIGLLYAPQPLLNVISQDFGTDKATTALAVSTGLFPLAIAPLFYGPLVSRATARQLLTGILLLVAATGAGLYFAPSFNVLLGWRVVQGMLAPAMMTAIMTYISRQFHGSDLQRALAIYIGCTILGGFISRATSGGISTLFGWRTALLCMALAPLPALAVLYRMRDEARPVARRHSFREYLTGLLDPGVGSLMLIEAMTFFVFGGISNFLPFRMAELGEGNSEFMVGLMYAGYILGVLVSFNSRRLTTLCGGPAKLMFWGLIVYVPMLPALVLKNGMAVFGALCLICLGHFTAHSNAPGLINRLTTLDKGMINGLYLTCYYGGGSLGSWLPGFVYHAYGWNGCMILFGAMIALTLLLTWRLRYIDVLR